MRTTDRVAGDERGPNATATGDTAPAANDAATNDAATNAEDATPATIDRRRFVGALGVAVTAGLAGCSSGGSSGPPIERPESHAQDMTIGIVEDGTERVQQEVHLELDDPDFLMEFSTHAADGGFPVFDGRFIKADGSIYVQMGGLFCQEYGQSESDVQAMAATPERFESNGALEQTGTETIEGTEVEVYEADVDDLPLDQLSFQPQSGAGGSDFGGQMPGENQEAQTPAYLDPDNVEEGTLTLWIGAENRYLHQAEQTATFSSDGSTFSFEMAAENYDFGESFDIQAPSNCGEGGFGSGSGDGSSDGGFGGDGFGG